MEQTRIILAIALSALVFLGYNYFFPPVPEKATEAVSTSQPVTSGVSEMQGGAKGTISAPLTTDGAGPSAVVSRPARALRIETPLYMATFSENGALLTSFVLKQYRKTADSDSAALEMVDPVVVKDTLAVFLQGTEEPDLSQGQYTADSSSDRIEIAADGNKSLVFEKMTPLGMIVQKRFSFKGDSYLFNLDVSIKNSGSGVVKGPLALVLKKDFPAKSGSYGFEGPNALVNGTLQEIKIEDIAKQGRLDGQIEWIGLQDRYFNSSIIPLTVTQGAASSLRYDNAGYAEHTLLQPIAEIQPGGVSEASFKVYFGPKSLKVMSAVGHNLGKAVDFGFFDILAKPLLWFMNFIYSLIPNYGVAIILLTLLTKIVLWPLGSKSYRSMSQMKKIQPLMLQIREKHKDDKKRMNEETMALYRLYKVNPMGGCLPMVVQIPVFFALYRMLYETIELRHAPFFGWINDLSAPDRLFDFGVSIPFMDPPFGIPVLTIVMGATMFIQQKMSPPMGDPAQAKMMLLMPIVFTVIFINFSSGLVLYWLINNVFSIAQQYYTQKNT